MTTIFLLSLLFFHYFILVQQMQSKNKMEKRSTEITIDLNTFDMSSLEQNDSRVIAEIRRRFLIPPPPRGTPYFLKNPQLEDPSAGQSKKVLDLLQNMTGGFFIECGALDGEFLSNTLYMERKLGWTGLLVEADPKFLEMIYKMQRHAWVAPVCLSTKPSPMFVQFNSEEIVGHGHIGSNNRNNKDLPYVQCIPIYSLLLALNRTTVDYFSLDVEGAEMDILRTIPFHLVDIRVFTIEYREENKKDLQQFMTEKGYELHMDFHGANIMAHDFILVKKLS